MITLDPQGTAAAAAAAATRPARVALAGFGTVGRSVARLLQHTPDDARLAAILTRRAAERRGEWPASGVTWTESIDEALDGADVFVELIGGLDPAERWIRTALGRGIPVVTANKQVIAERGSALFPLAAARGCELRFEGAVAGGIPVLGAIAGGLAGDAIAQVAGILNGTCNFILTRMEQDGAPFDDALREAQALGFAEANPAQDIEGLDARAKLAILAMVALRVQVTAGAIPAQSIAAVTPLDFQYAHRLHATIRQVAWAARNGAGDALAAGVGPALVPLTSPLARVSGSENLVTVRGQFGGETSFGGRGAGGGPTAVAVVSDLLAIARGARQPRAWRPLPQGAVSTEFATPYYVRFTVADRPGIIAALASIFAAHGINIDAVLQEPGFPDSARPFVVTLDAAPSASVAAALRETAALAFHVVPPLALPVLRSGAPERP